MKLFQSQALFMNGEKIYTSTGEGFPSDCYPNGGEYCYHDFIEMEFFLEGSGIHYLNTIPYQVQAGYFYLLMPGDYHYYSLNESVRFSLYNIKVDARLPNQNILKQFANFSKPYAVYLSGDEFDMVHREVEFLLSYKKEKKTDDLFAQNIVERIILLLLKNLKHQEKHVHGHIPPTIQRIIDYVHIHYPEEISSACVAALAGLSVNYFSSYFKQNVGLSFCDYLTRVRLFRAVELMETTQLSLKEIATQVGFSSQAYFTRMFVRQFKISPSQYRKEKTNSIQI